MGSSRNTLMQLRRWATVDAAFSLLTLVGRKILTSISALSGVPVNYNEDAASMKEPIQRSVKAAEGVQCSVVSALD